MNPVGSNISYSRLIKTVSNTNKFNVCQRVFDAFIALGGVGSGGGDALVMMMMMMMMMMPRLMVDGGHKRNVWEIMQCPEYTLKCNKNVHLPA